MICKSEKSITNEPHNEYIYLLRNSWLYVAVGILFLLEALILITEGMVLWGTPLPKVIDTIALLSLPILVVLLVQTIRSTRFISSSSFWFGYLTDKHLEYINNKGYKYGFTALLIFACVFAFRVDSFLPSFESLTMPKLGGLFIAVASLTYGITVLCNLKNVSIPG